jgi:hypothetical protein
MVDSKEKGNRAELAVRDKLREYTGLGWERTPSSGALDPRHLLKGDLYIPGVDNTYAVEVKHYADDQLNSTILTSKSPTLLVWWEQAVRQANQMNKKPLLIFKHDRSKLFVAFHEYFEEKVPFLMISHPEHPMFWVALLEDWIRLEKPKFIK